MRIVVSGNAASGGVQLRGMQLVARAIEEDAKWIFTNTASKPRLVGKIEYCYHIKSLPDLAFVRRVSEVLIWDPLDCWSQHFQDITAEKFWRKMFDKYKFDAIVASSWSCFLRMRAALDGTRAQVVILPHASDPRLTSSFSPDGPVVYCGSARYVQGYEASLEAAAKQAGKKLELYTQKSQFRDALRGVSAALSLRLNERSLLNKHCKPQIKIENAVVAGVPVISLDDPCSSSLYSDHPSVQFISSIDQLSDAISAASQNRCVKSEPLDLGLQWRLVESWFVQLAINMKIGNRLDLGCGAATKLGPEVVGVDIAAHQRIYRHDFTKIGMRQNTIDRVSLFHAIEHITRDDGVKLLSDLRSAIKPGGIVEIETPCRDLCESLITKGSTLAGAKGLLGGRAFNKPFWEKQLIEWARHRSLEKIIDIASPGEKHLYVWSAGELEKIATNTGFRVSQEVPTTHGKRSDRDMRLVLRSV